jgi:hypothetical protein
MNPMSSWEYALIVQDRIPAQGNGWGRKVTWYPPSGPPEDVSSVSTSALVHLNRVGREGWELVSVTGEHHPDVTNRKTYRYHLKRALTEPRPTR